MQNIEHDMDDLFRKAADNYPLKSGDGNWETVLKKIDQKNYTGGTSTIKKPGSRRKYILFIFLFISLSASWLIFKNTFNEKPVSAEKKNVVLSNPVKNSKPLLKKNETIIQNTAIINQQKNLIKTGQVQPEQNNNPFVIDAGITQKYLGTINERNDFVMDKFTTKLNLSSAIENATMEIVLNNNTNYLNNIPNIQTDKTSNKKENGSTAEKTIKNIGVFKKGFYVGLTTAIDFSNVKSMSNNKAGYGLGILVGYTISKKISLETGLTINRKNYFTEGRYFNIDKVKSSMPAGMEINSLVTKSSIIEIPLNIKYNVINNKKSNVFVSGGLSAYIMTKEKNNYKADLNGNEEEFSGVYTKNDYGLPAEANLSLGYQHFISKKINIVIEPFLKVPLNGMGVGNLPITSAGLRLSIAHSLH